MDSVMYSRFTTFNNLDSLACFCIEVHINQLIQSSTNISAASEISQDVLDTLWDVFDSS